ncbi:MAG TPA: hypothetical protein VJH94_00145 [Candidatus Paceibacterota bacterium]
MEEKMTLLLTEYSDKTRHVLVNELLTPTERTMLAKRIALVFLIEQNAPTRKICRLLKMSPSSVARFQVKVERGTFSKTMEWIQRSRTPIIIKMLLQLASIPFTAQRRSLKQLLQEL